MAQLITKRSGEDYDWQAEVIARIEQDGGDPGDPETWSRYCAEVAADEAAEADEELEMCAQCEQEWPADELVEGVCPDCRIRAYYEARMRRLERERIVDGGFEISDADPGL